MGLISRTGVIPLNPEQDSAGSLTQYVKDSAIILQVIAGMLLVDNLLRDQEVTFIVGKDELDAATRNIPFDTIPDYEAACDKEGWKGVRVAVRLKLQPFAFGTNLCDIDPAINLRGGRFRS